MNWELLFLVCFIVGFTFSILSFVGGLSRFHFHTPKHIHFGGHGPAGGHGTAQSHGISRTHGASNFPFVNPMTAAAFLTWFGGTGYLLLHVRHLWILAGLAFSTLAGLAGAALVFLFVVKVLMAHEKDLDPLDYEMAGVLGQVSVSIREGGTGEIIFAQEGVRKTCAARSDTGSPLPKGEEIVVARYERGVAYVRRWEEFVEPASSKPEPMTRQ
jgi:membrane protein implicated in regulation of membrane protease activity